MIFFNKMDLMLDDEVNALCEAVLEKIQWQGPVYKVSALSKPTLDLLIGNLMERLEVLREQDQQDQQDQEDEPQFTEQ